MALHIDPPVTRREALGPLLMALATLAGILLIVLALERAVRHDAARWNEVHHVRR
jgi:hypothetical protein